MPWRFRTGTEKYPALTGMRAFCAISVFFLHFPLFEKIDLSVNLLAFFFVLSGFLIIRIYFDQARIERDWLSHYFINRFARIYPVYFLLLTIAVLLRHEFHPWVLLKNYTLTHALFHKYQDIVIEQSWSLTVEECFYFLAPVLILLIRRWNFWAALGFTTGLLGIALLISVNGTSFLGTPVFVFTTTFFGHFFEFFAGIGLALVIRKREAAQAVGTADPAATPETSGTAAAAPKKGIGWTSLGLVGIVAVIIPIKIVYAHPPLDVAWIIFLNNFGLALPIALFYFGLITENTFLSRISSGRVFGLLGRSSYAFYLLNVMVMNYFGLPLLHTLFGGSHFIMVMATFIGSYFLAILVFLFYEEPLNRLIRKKFRSGPPHLIFSGPGQPAQ